eukprot:TRINITY_DN103108_c0_g1_i1.p1 TRINITY_DN103108_c0_g1~~TRINITY_DN103108_c0_g1_i1.p1  ORF type:complete len:923 (-),score=194.77 TRINITY_DN103108_c0_g1_i1:238-3006(-)
MAELARWQWDDMGTWRDFAEQYQAQMEAAFQRRDKSVEVTIPPFGTFKMDVVNMTQTTLQGRNPGYEREIRRQVRKIDLGYFLLGFEGEIHASDSVVDSIEDERVLDSLAEALRRIVDDPEDFAHRSINLSEDEYRETIGSSEEAQQFLEEAGFEKVKEGPQCFLIFMQEQVDSLSQAEKEVKACLERLRKRNSGNESNKVVEAESNSMPLREASDQDPTKIDQASVLPARAASFQGDKPTSVEINIVLPSGKTQLLVLPGDATLESLLEEVKAAVPGLRLPLLSSVVEEKVQDSEAASTNEASPPSNAVSNAPSNAVASNQRNDKGKGKRERKNKGGKNSDGKGGKQNAAKSGYDGKRSDAGEAADSPQSEQLLGRAPLLDFALASEPGLWLGRACPEQCTVRDASEEVMSMPRYKSGKAMELPTAVDEDGEPGFPPLPTYDEASPPKLVAVEDFESAFVTRLQMGLLRLRDLSAVAPLLDWEKPELLKIVHGRTRSLLEGSCDAWCQAARCTVEDELLCSRALLLRIHGGRSLADRLQVCRELLPAEKRDGRKATLEVDRGEDFLTHACTGLMKLSVEELRRPLEVRFKGELAEDHGGPRRDFFGMLGSRLPVDLNQLWRRLPKGSLAPVPDLVAEGSPKDARAGLDDVDAAYRACGRACGLAAKYGDVLGEELAGFFLHQVARDDTVGLDELQQQIAETEGAEDFRASQVVRKQSVEETGIKGLTLSRTITGTAVEVDLVPGGRNVPVTDDNKEEWLQLHLHDKLYGSLRKATDAFRLGVLDIFGGARRTCPLLVLLLPFELAKIWAGSAVSREAVCSWREVSTVSEEVKSQAAWFWEIMEEADDAYRARVLKFTTGVHRLGHLGLQAFEIQPADGSDESLPRAMTCANMLQMPRYTSKESLEKQLRKAVECCEGFQIL